MRFIVGTWIVSVIALSGMFPGTASAETAEREAIPFKGTAEIRYAGSLIGERTEQESFESVAMFSGADEPRQIAMNPLVIERDATVHVIPEVGSFHPSSGTMTLPAVVKVSYGFLRTETRVLLTTGSASSGSRYTGSGVPFDAATRQVVLVGAGTASGYEFFIKVNAALDRTPAPSAADKPVAAPKQSAKQKPKQNRKTAPKRPAKPDAKSPRPSPN